MNLVRFPSASLWFYESQFYFYITLFSISRCGWFFCVCVFFLYFAANDVTHGSIHFIQIYCHAVAHNELEYLNSLHSKITKPFRNGRTQSQKKYIVRITNSKLRSLFFFHFDLNSLSKSRRWFRAHIFPSTIWWWILFFWPKHMTNNSNAIWIENDIQASWLIIIFTSKLTTESFGRQSDCVPNRTENYIADKKWPAKRKASTRSNEPFQRL